MCVRQSNPLPMDCRFANFDGGILHSFVSIPFLHSFSLSLFLVSFVCLVFYSVFFLNQCHIRSERRKGARAHARTSTPFNTRRLRRCHISFLFFFSFLLLLLLLLTPIELLHSGCDRFRFFEILVRCLACSCFFVVWFLRSAAVLLNARSVCLSLPSRSRPPAEIRDWRGLEWQ